MGWVNPKHRLTYPKKWVGFGDWVDMVLKNEKNIKSNGFLGKTRPRPNKLTYPIMSVFLFLFS